MKIISYNVNGIRASIKKGMLDWLRAESPDILCIQETKAHKKQVDPTRISQAGYPYQYWFSAQKKGYSGVAIFCKEEPNQVSYGTGIETIDFEGRNLRVDFDKFSVMSLYLPSGTNHERLNFKFDYMAKIQKYLSNLRREISDLVVCGDFNICHEAIDIHNPNMKGVSGFLPEERAWIENFIKSGFIDSFRHLHKESNRYSWWSYRANSRANNKGWRIDYQMISESLKENLSKAYILTDVKHSDHCPIGVELQF